MTRQCSLRTKVRILSAALVQFLAVLTLLTVFGRAAMAQTINPTTRTVTTTNFVVVWNTGNDVEAITTLDWAGGANVTNSWALDTCAPAFPGTVEYFGDSFAPPDPWLGGLALVGGGTTTPPGTTAWSGQILSSGAVQVSINSASTGCPPSSAGINVATTYNFLNPEESSTNSFGLQRAFDFTTTTFAHDFRPYMPRLSLSEGFTEALYPTTSNTLATLDVFDCGDGCTGPTVVAGAAPLNPPWDATQGWFAIHNPNTLQGVVVARSPSTDPQGNPIVAQLWVDNDSSSYTNSSSFLLMSPTAGFTGGSVTEVETLCFYNSSIWTPSLTPPAPCNNTGTTPSATTLISSPNPSVYGQSVTLTASVTSSSGTPTGSVLFTDTSTSTTLGSATLLSGTASLAVSSLAAGTHAITAAYQGSSTFSGSTSTPVSQTVSSASTTTSLTSSLNPASANQTITFTATVTSQYGGADTGTVTFYSGSQTLGSGSLSGNSATLNTSFSSAGTYSITAKYNGDANNLGSTSSVLSQVINAALISTTTTLTSSLNPSTVGQSVTFTAAVISTSGAPPNGELVTFYNGSAVLGTGSLTGGIASYTTSSLAAGIYTITATYAGDANFAASTSPWLKQTVNSTTKSATSTTMTSNLNPSIYGQHTTLTATVTTSGSIAPTGKVKFTWDSGVFSLGTGTLNSSGVATVTRDHLNADVYPITATYDGDANNLGSSSPTFTQTITQATSSLTLTSSANPSTAGESVTFTAKISSPYITPTGQITFTAGKTTLGTGQLENGKANFTTSTLAVGSTTVTASYPDSNDLTGSSASVVQTVTSTP
ncbi:MAG: Ig-like domain repeat protein [Candidatus Sulfotelmatobacter sp.]